MVRNPSMYQESFLSLTRYVFILPSCGLDVSQTLLSRRVTHLYCLINFSICLMVSHIVVPVFIHFSFAKASFAHNSFS